MGYKVLHITNGKSASTSIREHGYQVQEALNKIGEAEIYSVQHAQAGDYGQYASTLIIYREYEA